MGSINEDLQIVHILEFKRSIDWDEGFLEVKKQSTKASSVRSKLLLQSGNSTRLTL